MEINEIKTLQKALADVSACRGNCKECRACVMDSATVGRSTCYAFRCSKAVGMCIYSDSLRDLKSKTLRGLITEF